jgi:putative glutamine amidotransferase
VIGVPAQSLHLIDDLPHGLPGSSMMSDSYFTALSRAGGLPWLIPLLADDPDTLRAIFDRLDGLLLAGGVDVDPDFYGAVRAERCGKIDRDRDRVELPLTRWALEEGKPVLGICRGVQLLNVAMGGTLVQDCSYLENPDKHDYYPSEGWERDHLAHEVQLTTGSRLREIFGAPSILVNSSHHQVLERVARALAVTGVAPDGVVEAIEGSGRSFLAGVQWHPELLIDSDAGSQRLFDAFVGAAAEFAGAR